MTQNTEIVLGTTALCLCAAFAFGVFLTQTRASTYENGERFIIANTYSQKTYTCLFYFGRFIILEEFDFKNNNVKYYESSDTKIYTRNKSDNIISIDRSDHNNFDFYTAVNKKTGTIHAICQKMNTTSQDFKFKIIYHIEGDNITPNNQGEIFTYFPISSEYDMRPFVMSVAPPSIEGGNPRRFSRRITRRKLLRRN